MIRFVGGLLMMLVALVGCDTFSKVSSDNPVMPPAPPRTASTNSGDAATGIADDFPESSLPEMGSLAEMGSLDVVRPVSNVPVRPSTGLSNSQVLATVNASPIFASDVFSFVILRDKNAESLVRARAVQSDEDYRKLRDQLIKTYLSAQIENEMLLQALKQTVKQEQITAIEKHLKSVADERIELMMEQMRVNNRRDLKRTLEKLDGPSPENISDVFVNQQMAMEYLRTKLPKKKISRVDLIGYYEEHADDYTTSARVNWQQIFIEYQKHGGRGDAFRVLEKAIAELRSGAPFEAVARKFSDGPNAEEGGQRGWVQLGSLSDETIENALFELPVGTISQILERDRGFYLVKVNKREAAGKVEFAEVQDKIQKTLQREAQQEAAKKVFTQLKETTVIKTMFDPVTQPQTASRANR